MSALESLGRQPAKVYEGSTMYTTLSPCDMCTGACILYKVSRVVMYAPYPWSPREPRIAFDPRLTFDDCRGENTTFTGGEDTLQARGIDVVNLKNAECEELMKTFIREHPEDWWVMMRG